VVKTMSFVDPELLSAFAESAGPTVQWLKTFGLRFDFLPTQFLTKSQPRLLPVGGGLALVEALAGWAEANDVKFFYETVAQDLIVGDDGEVIGVRARGRNARSVEFGGRAVVLGSGGFAGNLEMMSQYLGNRALFLRPICRGGYYNRGEGIRMALAIGAASCGDFASYHAEPIDPRSGIAEPSVFIFPYGVLVNRSGMRFVDEAMGTVDAYYERITRRIFEQPEGIAYTILDAKITDVPNYKLGLRTDQPPIVADTLAGLAARLEIPVARFEATIAEYNKACGPGTFKPLEPDHLATQGIEPKKSNWARPIDRAPFTAYPVISANVFTFGGLKVNANGQVLHTTGDPIPGLYAAGEVIGLYYRNYTGATSVLKGAVFGRLAGKHGAERCVRTP
jgi:tricarballylate dehydrogenase